jgi:hypothetical protein
MRDFQTRGYSQYGASMGRSSDLPFESTGPLTVRHVPLDEGGYDPGGAYWGAPDNLYVVESEDGDVRYLRAGSADRARAKFPRATWAPVTDGPTEEDIADMLDGYVTCALWSSTGDDDRPLDEDHSPDDLADEARSSMRADVEAFAKENAQTILACLGHGRCDWSRAGHDLWLNRNGHGCGFWDGDWPDAEGKRLTQAAKALGESYVYVGDDGKVYVS